MIEKGKDETTELLLKYAKTDKLLVDEFVSNYKNKEYVEFTNRKELDEGFNDFLYSFISKLSEEEIEAISAYSGLSYGEINSILRGSWSYEQLGTLTDERKEKALNLSTLIRGSIFKAPSLPFNLKVYRGVNHDAFSKYRIYSIEDLYFLKDKYVYEEGFSSTSLVRDTSLFGNNPENGKEIDVELEILVPENSEDGIPLTNNILTPTGSYQNEFLINSHSMFKVIDVDVSMETKTAKLRMMMLPEKLWNPIDYQNERERYKTKSL